MIRGSTARAMAARTTTVCCGQDMAGRPTPNGAPMAFLLSTIDANPSVCTLWPFARNQRGYGKLYIPGRGMRYAHAVLDDSGPPPTSKHEVAHQPLICHRPKSRITPSASSLGHQSRKRGRYVARWHSTPRLSDQWGQAHRGKRNRDPGSYRQLCRFGNGLWRIPSNHHRNSSRTLMALAAVIHPPEPTTRER